MALATIGTDTGGSIRIPAAACGIVGLKARWGEISAEGVIPLSRRLDHIGPLARTVADASLVYRVLAGGSKPKSPVPVPLNGLKLAVPRGYFCDVLDDEVRGQFDAALDRLRSGGVRVSDVAIRHASLTAPAYLHLVLADAAAVHARTLEQVPDLYTAPVRMRLEMGRYVLAEDYVRALEARELLRREVDSALAGFDALVLPALPIPAPTIGVAAVQIGGVTRLEHLLRRGIHELQGLTHRVSGRQIGGDGGGAALAKVDQLARHHHLADFDQC
jgi:aspartyl-tRNA(Asn)/glutamyl-tRNA(Gln) amidotransferase subunit A